MTFAGTTPKGALLALILSILPLTLPAAAPDAAAGSFRLGLTAHAFDYEEYDDRDNSLDRERGLLPGLSIGATLERERWLVEGSLRYCAGEVDYTSAAVDSKTDEAILDLQLTGGVRLYREASQGLSLLAGAGYRRWSREIHSTATVDGLGETYRWSYGLIGLRGDQALDDHTRLVADLSLTRSFNPRLDVDFIRYFDDTRLDLGAKNGFRASLDLQRELGAGRTLWVKPWYEYWQLGRSSDATLTINGIPTGTLFEPDSETRDWGIDIGLSWRFPGG
ncbi:MAG: hypothetical protein P8178_17910 [Candidatus Thiodiazotropha sp.]